MKQMLVISGLLLSSFCSFGQQTLNYSDGLQVGSSTQKGVITLGGDKGYSAVGAIPSSGDLFLGRNVYTKYINSSDASKVYSGSASNYGLSALLLKSNGVMEFYGKSNSVAADYEVNQLDNLRFKIAENGNFGIGVSTPLAKLHIANNNQSTIRLSAASGQNPEVYQSEITNNYDSGNAFQITNGGYNLLKATGGGYSKIEIGNSTNQNLFLNTQKLTFPLSVKLGIGTDNPQSSLDIQGINNEIVIRGRGANGNGYTLLADKYTTTESQINIGLTYSGAYTSIGQGVKPNNTTVGYVSSHGQYAGNRSAIEMGLDVGIRFLQKSTNDNVALGTAVTMTEAMRIQNGNVGIGTTNVDAKFVVNGNPTTGDKTLIRANGTNARLTFDYNGEGASYYDGVSHNLRNAQGEQIMVVNNSSINTFRQLIANQRILIGSSDAPSDYKLAVNGNIIANKIVVKQFPWADFVFKPEYKLPPLSIVEQHIKEKGHLQDIPSEKEVNEKGLDLGDMNAKLLQKIEELTLYIIAQEKRIQKLEEQSKKK
jgi:hypothetical protein